MSTILYPDLQVLLPFDYKIIHLPTSSPKRSSNSSMDWEYITVHNTLRYNSTGQEEIDSLNDPLNTSVNGFHIVVDRDCAIEAVPLNETVRACGDGETGDGDQKSIQIELCTQLNPQYIIHNTAELIAHLLYFKDYDISRVKQHFHWTGKNCPRVLREHDNASWNLLISKIEYRLDQLINGKPYETIEMDHVPIFVSSTFYISARPLLDTIGGTISQYSIEEKSFSIEFNRKKWSFFHGTTQYIDYNRQIKFMDTAPIQINETGDFYIPLSMIGFFGGVIDSWNPVTNTAVLKISDFTLTTTIGDSYMYKANYS